MEHEGDGPTNCSWCIWGNPQKTDKGTGRSRNKKTGRIKPDYSIIKIGKTCQLNSSEKPSGNASVKNSKE